MFSCISGFLKKAYFRFTKISGLKLTKSLASRFLLLTILIVLIPMALTSLYVYKIISSDLRDKMSKDINLVMQQTNENLNTQFKNIDDTISLIVSNKIIREAISDLSIDIDEYTSLENKINVEKELSYCSILGYSPLMSKSVTPTIIKRIYLFKQNNVFYKIGLRSNYNEEEFDNMHKELFLKSKKAKADSFFFPVNSKDQTIYLNCNIKSLENSAMIGKIFLDIDENIVSDIYKNISQYPLARWYLLDGKGTILSAYSKDQIGNLAPSSVLANMNSEETREISLDENKYISAIKNIGKYGLTSVILIPEKQIFSDLWANIMYYLYIVFIILLLALLIGLFSSYKMTVPIKDLIHNITMVGDGNFDIKMPVYAYKELNELSGVFNRMTAKIQHLITDVYQKQLLLKESELKSLLAQINPHFLFNVLETVSWYAQAGRTEDIYNIVTSLGQIMRANINATNREKNSIKEELDYVAFYVAIQKYRFEDRLQFELNLEDDLIKEYFIPKLCLQPIVENAILHGIEEKIGVGKLTLNIFTEATDIIFEVIDDGVGFDTGKINKPSIPKNDNHTNIGIQNSNKRIKLLYGEEYGLSIVSSIGSGTKVTIKIPMDRDGV